MAEQITNHIMMIRPVSFQRNEQTAVNNHYQKRPSLSPVEIRKKAIQQFDEFVKKLRAEGVDVTVFQDTLEPSTPDSIFPNNWISFHEEGSIILYPMFAQNRRLERREELIDQLKKQFEVNEVKSYAEWESKDVFLEGTGSLLLDRQHRIAYAALSDRTSEELLERFCTENDYQGVTFTARQTVEDQRLPIYHTNVMMCLGEELAVVCLNSIDNKEERLDLIDSLRKTGKEIIEISENQKEQFAGNMLQVIGSNNERLMVMSTAAFESLDDDQKTRLEKHGRIVHSDIHTIEKLGGGSARCMMAEIFLPLKVNKASYA